MAEFTEQRSKLYAKALSEFPHARDIDLRYMQRLLDPQVGERILCVGAGSGYFLPSIARRVGETGSLIVLDPSSEQLAHLPPTLGCHVETLYAPAEDFDLETKVDKIWSFGAFHHVTNKGQALRRFYDSLSGAGKMVICDVWEDSALARHFDGPVAKYCITGHDVEFLSNDSIISLLEASGFGKYHFEDLPIEWVFNFKEEIGRFIYLLHAMENAPGQNQKEKEEFVLRGCEEILGIREEQGAFYLNWPMKAVLAHKI